MPQNMEGHEYLVVELACEVNEKGTRENNDGNENTSMDDKEMIEVSSDEGSLAEEDWNEPEQTEVRPPQLKFSAQPFPLIEMLIFSTYFSWLLEYIRRKEKVTFFDLSRNL